MTQPLYLFLTGQESMQDLSDLTESPKTLSILCWSGSKVETADESEEIFIVDFHTSKTVSKNKYGMKLSKEF